MKTSNWGCSDARYNQSSTGVVSLDTIFAEGAFRYVAKGVYSSGPRQSEPFVMKWFKPGVSFEDNFYALDFKIVTQALLIARKFNQLHLVNKIRVTIPATCYFTDNEPSGRWAKGQRFLGEPFVENYQKWNSNTGWNDTSTEWGKAMQALSHFSYHTSRGKRVLCDLQGGIKEGEGIITDPAILSRNRDYGATDLGQDGIINFFSQHVCSKYCRSSWIKPDNPTRRLNPVSGTCVTAKSPALMRTAPARIEPMRIAPMQIAPRLISQWRERHQWHHRLFESNFPRGNGIGIGSYQPLWT